MGIDSTNQSLKEFNLKLKRHLSNDYMRMSEKRTELESELVQLKVDKDRRDKKLFQSIGQVNVKRYFSPLNIEDSSGKNNDEKLEQLKANIERIELEIKNISSNMIEIQSILKGADTFLNYKDRRYQANHSKDAQDKEYKKQLENQLVDSHLKKNLKELIRVYHDQYEYLEIILEFEDHDIALDEKLCKNILMQIVNNINIALEEYHATMIVIEGDVKDDRIELNLNYICEDDGESTVNIIYSIEL